MSKNQPREKAEEEKIAAVSEEEAIKETEQPVAEESTLLSAPKKVEAQKPGGKRIRTLFIALGILIVLGGGLAGAYFGGLFNEEDVTSEVSEVSEEEMLPSLADYSSTGTSAIKKITVKNDTGTYALVPNEDGAMAIEGYGDLPRDAAAIDNLLIQYTAVTPELVIAENPTDEQIVACGLDKPAITVTTDYTDGKSLTVSYGRVATGGSSGYYGMIPGGDTLWLFREDYYQAAMNKATYYVGKTLMTAPSPNADDTAGAAKLKTLVVTDGSEPFLLRYVEPQDDNSIRLCGKYVFEKPFYHAADGELVSDWDSSLCSLYAADIEAIHPTADVLSKLGFDNPQAVGELTFGIYQATDNDGNSLKEPKWYNEITYTLTVGNSADSGTCYAMIDGVDVVYVVNTVNVPWVGVTYETLVNKSLFLRYITDLSAIDATANGKTYTLTLSHGKAEDESGVEQATLTARLNGKEILEGNARSLYQQMMTVKRVAAAPSDATASGTPVLSLGLCSLNGDKDTTFAFYPYSPNRYLCVASDGDRFLVKTADVEALSAQLKSMAAISDKNEDPAKTKETSKKNNP